MTTLNFKEMLQTEIDKVQGYVNVKEESIANKEFDLVKDKNHLTDLKIKLKELTDKKNEFVSFEQWQSSNVKPVKTKTASKEDTATAKELAKEIVNSIEKQVKVEEVADKAKKE